MTDTLSQLAESKPHVATLQQELDALREWSEDALLPVMDNSGVKRVTLEVTADGEIVITTDKDAE